MIVIKTQGLLQIGHWYVKRIKWKTRFFAVWLPFTKIDDNSAVFGRNVARKRGT